MKTHYEVLGLLPQAEDVVVKAAYKALAQKFHPDKHKGHKDQYTELMARINSAYEVLGNKDLRQKYDQLLEQRAQRKAKADKAKDDKPRPEHKPKTDKPKAAKTGTRHKTHDALIEQLRHNAIDEVTAVNLYEEVFKCTVTINNGWINTYTVKTKSDRKVLNFSHLKDQLLAHFSEEET